MTDETSKEFLPTEFTNDSSDTGIFGRNAIFFWIIIFKIIIIIILISSCLLRRKRRLAQAQGYSIGVVSVNGQQGFIATPPQRTVVQMQHPPPTASGVAPPPYNPNYSHPPVYTTMPHQTKY
ncbi:uncharacterized protein LOC123290409 isoform X3 [Chrysoperla carnea]|uniref:uncharacterized protein LOC123290409 isoform X3 n=1 Tax=Chrysoperla carnea TaxID=189513 RepID=UPI001D08ECC5|nr:uncharacterized protein LOC123290409 isoform X3 [Chrysoperla carnea]